jgi:CO/xanthine dehydrogenase FAD-binding subunit
VKPPPVRYVRPGTLAEATAALAEAGDDAKVLAGGQSLVPMLNFRLARPTLLVDVAGLPELAGIERRNGDLDIGAGVTQLAAERSSEVAAACPLVHTSFRHIGHVQTRSRGTVGGSLAHADPAAELPAVALALGARVVAESVRGQRTIAAGELFLGPYWSALAEDEIVTRVLVPAHEGTRVACVEYARRAGDFALAGVAAALTVDAGGTIESARMAAFGVGPAPVRLTGVEELLVGHALGERLPRETSERAAEQVDPMDDPRASAAYRRRLVGVMARRAVEEAAGG